MSIYDQLENTLSLVLKVRVYKNYIFTINVLLFYTTI